MPVLQTIPSSAQSTHNMNTITPAGNLYNDPQGLRGTPVESSVGKQKAENAFYIKKALMDSAKKRIFSKFASTTNMPKNRGQRLRQQIDYPLLDDRNLNDQGIDARGVQIRNGNLYGSSRDIGKILGAMPTLTEIGGRVNRVGFSRAEVEGTFNKFGFFFEYSQDLDNFDSDTNIVSSMHSKALTAAEQVTEDALAADLLNGAGTVIYAGNAISNATMDETSIVTYQAIKRLSRALDDTKTPRHTKYITGSSNLDTRTATTYRSLIVGNEVLALLENLKDNFGEKAFIPSHQYMASNKTLFENEVGIIDKFRVILADEMPYWAGEGADDTNAINYGLSSSNGKYDIYPMICIGDDAFTCISFNGSNGINNKFNLIHKKPSSDTASAIDPYGELGFVSIKWWYGIMFQRPERIGIIKTVAPL